eukprot:4947890-Prymnesium_polylepis.1
MLDRATGRRASPRAARATHAAFVHLDADIYESTKLVLRELCQRHLLQAGSVLSCAAGSSISRDPR